MPSRPPAVIPIIVALVLAGCLDTAPVPGGNNHDATSVGFPPAYAYACPEGAAKERVPGVCVGTLARVAESLQEPFVALHPTRPEVIAIGVNEGETREAVHPSHGGVTAAHLRLVIYLSEDGGATWRRSAIPEPAPPAHLPPRVAYLTADPALAFDSRGALHVSGVYIPFHLPDPAKRATAIAPLFAFHTRSDDLAHTWTPPTLLSRGGDDDRNWLRIGPDDTVFVTWQNYRDRSSEVVWTRDGGGRWDRVVIEDCVWASSVAFLGSTPLVGCHGLEGNRTTALQVYRIDLEAPLAERLGGAAVSGSYPAFISTAPDGTLVAGISQVGPGSVSWASVLQSRDGGRTWSELLNLSEVLAVDDGWKWFYLTALEADPWGGIHVVLEGGTVLPSTCRVASCEAGEAPLGHALAHAVLDAARLTRVQETPLTPPWPEQREDRSAALQGYDDVHSVAFAHDRGVLAWHFDKGVDFTRLKPMDP